eukprot:5788469-Prymnesium_polylepis.1
MAAHGGKTRRARCLVGGAWREVRGGRCWAGGTCSRACAGAGREWWQPARHVPPRSRITPRRAARRRGRRRARAA